MSATVTIAATELDPGGSFLRYTADLGASMPRLKFSVTGAQFCGYSSQRLSGTLQGQPGAIDFADRITHIWTNTKKYLVAIHLEGPARQSRLRRREIDPDAGLRRRHSLKPFRAASICGQ